MNLTYFIEEYNSKAQYVIDFILRTIGIKATRTKVDTGVDIYYGNAPKSGEYKIRIIRNEKQCGNMLADDIIWKDLVHGKISSTDVRNDVSFDIIRAIEFLLLDFVNDSVRTYDEHHRILAIDSFQHRHNILSLPLVNLYVLFLKDLIETRTQIVGFPFWPDGKLCAIGLSHDVDAPDTYEFGLQVKARLQRIGGSIKRRKALRTLRSVAGTIKFVVKFPFIKQHYWLFEQIMREEEKCGVKSTFFFLSRNKLSQGAHPSFDASYDIAQGRFRRVFEDIKEHRFEIGLHASYNAYKSPENLREEKARLESITNTKFWECATTIGIWGRMRMLH